MGYFKYYEDILEAIEESKYFHEVNEVLVKLQIAKNRQEIESIFKRYYVLKKIYYELIYKINLMNDLVEFKTNKLLEFVNKEKSEYKINKEYLRAEILKLEKKIQENNSLSCTIFPLSLLDKKRIKSNICDLVCNYAFTYMNESKFMDVRNIIKDIDALIYWAENQIDGPISHNNQGFIKTYICRGEFNNRICIHCGEFTPNECCYCLNCGSLIGVE